MTAVIETRELTKAYRSARGMHDMSLAVEEGEVFGFVGPNGAGKTTTIRTLLDLQRATSGGVRDPARSGADGPRPLADGRWPMAAGALATEPREVQDSEAEVRIAAGRT